MERLETGSQLTIMLIINACCYIYNKYIMIFPYRCVCKFCRKSW